MKIKNILVIFVISCILASCAYTPKGAAKQFMNDVKDHKFAAAAKDCGISKDPESKQLQMAMLEEKYGMRDNSVAAYAIIADSTLPDGQNAYVTMNVLYTDRHREDGVVLKLRKMNNKWIAQPFE